MGGYHGFQKILTVPARLRVSNESVQFHWVCRPISLFTKKIQFFSFFLYFFVFLPPRRPADDHRGGAKRQRGGRLRGRAAGASPLPVPCSLSLPMCGVFAWTPMTCTDECPLAPVVARKRDSFWRVRCTSRLSLKLTIAWTVKLTGEPGVPVLAAWYVLLDVCDNVAEQC